MTRPPQPTPPEQACTCGRAERIIRALCAAFLDDALVRGESPAEPGTPQAYREAGWNRGLNAAIDIAEATK